MARRLDGAIPLAPGPDGKRRRHRFTFVGNKTDADRSLIAKLHESLKRFHYAGSRTLVNTWLNG